MNGKCVDAAMLLKSGEGRRLESMEKRLDLLWKLGEETVWDTETDEQPACQKTVPSGAYAAEIGSIGGKTVAQDGALVSAAVTSVVSRDADAETLGTYEIPGTLLAYLADRDYGLSTATETNTLNLNTGSYIRKVKKRPFSELEFRESSYVTGEHTGYSATMGTGYGTRGSSALFTNILTTMEALGYSRNTSTEFGVMMADLKANSMRYAVRLSTSGEMLLYVSDFDVSDAEALAEKLADVEAVFGLPEAETYDVSGYLTDDWLLTAVPGGTLTFVQAGGTELAVPSSVDYLIKLSEVEE